MRQILIIHRHLAKAHDFHADEDTKLLTDITHCHQ